MNPQQRKELRDRIEKAYTAARREVLWGSGREPVSVKRARKIVRAWELKERREHARRLVPITKARGVALEKILFAEVYGDLAKALRAVKDFEKLARRF